MRTQRYSAALPALSLLALVACVSCPRAQEPDQRGTTSRFQSKEAPVTLTIAFKGGSLKDHVQAIRASGDHNIVVPDKADQVPVMALQLKNVTVFNALEVVAKTADRERFMVNVSRFEGQGNSVYAVNVEERAKNTVPRGMGNDPDSPTTSVFSIRNITSLPPATKDSPGVTMSAETVLSAIKIGIEISTKAGESRMPVLKYHEDSGLLFVQGSYAASSIVQRVLSEIEKDVEMRRAAAKLPKPNTELPSAQKGEDRR